MTDKAYIVANEEQEREVLEKLEREGLKWKGFSEEPTQWLPTRDIGYIDVTFPYVLFGNDVVSWCRISELQDDYEIVFDGRKEEQMSDKYVESQEFMNKLKEWKDTLTSNDDEYKPLVSWVNIKNLPETIYMWLGDDVPDKENNNRLIAIIRWVNGEDVFEVKPNKWVVRSIGLTDDDERYYVSIGKFMGLKRALNTYIISQATHFDTKKEAESWANSHQEVVEVEE